MEHVSVKVKKLRENAKIPKYQSAGAAGVDLHACVDVVTRILPGKQAIIMTGIAIELPLGFEAQLRPRSGLAAKHGISITNSPGTIDADFRGEIGVMLLNLGEQAFDVAQGDRIAQMVVQAVPLVHFIEADELSSTDRGAGGLGSTGVSA